MSENTFRDIERQLGIKDEPIQPRSSLEIWYESVRDKPIRDFSVDDLCRACRQKLYPSQVVPIALDRLHEDSLAGHQFDGELLCALRRTPVEFWETNVDQARSLRRIISCMTTIDDDELKGDIAEILSHLPPDELT